MMTFTAADESIFLLLTIFTRERVVRFANIVTRGNGFALQGRRETHREGLELTENNDKMS